MSITVAVIEDHPAFLAHFTGIIKSNTEFVLVGTATTGLQGLELVHQIDADIYLLGLVLSDMSGLDLLSQITLHRPHANAMIVSVSDDELNIVSAIERGAAGYLLIDAAPCAFISALHDLHAGTSPLSPAIAKKLLGVLRARTVDMKPKAAAVEQPKLPAREMLTERESQVLRELALGLAFREIAESLSISSHTVAQHVRNIYRKLAVSSRGRAVYEATKLGLLRK